MLRCPRLSELRSLIKTSLCVAYATFGGILSESSADDSAQPNSLIRISIRTIQATEPRNPATIASTDTSSTTASHIDAALHDVASKLVRLPFAKFHLLAQKEETLTLRKRNWIQLPNGQSLTFRPMDVENKKVGLWLNWKDRDGTEILNTRLHFDANDSVLTGTDGPHDQGLILAIKAVTEDGQ